MSKIDSNEIDSIIDDSETDIREFTNDQNCMKGAPFPREITDLNDDYPVTRQSAEFLSNMSATKTKFNQTYQLKDFEYKKECYLEILKQERKKSKKVHRATTKGKF